MMPIVPYSPAQSITLRKLKGKYPTAACMLQIELQPFWQERGAGAHRIGISTRCIMFFREVKCYRAFPNSLRLFCTRVFLSPISHYLLLFKVCLCTGTWLQGHSLAMELYIDINIYTHVYPLYIYVPLYICIYKCIHTYIHIYI